MPYVWLAAVALGAGAALSRLKLWYHCRTPESEACVWGKAYSMIAFPLETLVAGAVLFAILVAVRSWVRGRHGAGRTRASDRAEVP